MGLVGEVMHSEDHRELCLTCHFMTIVSIISLRQMPFEAERGRNVLLLANVSPPWTRLTVPSLDTSTTAFDDIQGNPPLLGSFVTIKARKRASKLSPNLRCLFRVSSTASADLAWSFGA